MLFDCACKQNDDLIKLIYILKYQNLFYTPMMNGIVFSNFIQDQLETLHDYTAPGSKICSATIKTPGSKSLIGEPKS